jgi:16S rRNA A1518/A1519 N6-dimethyltransferase RsmA/KsgA/DIM1 with predicted DNA glycosylase/AP lyase activity
MREDEMVALADVAKDQHFLVSPEKLAVMMRAADIRPTDRVVELGSGVGTVARTVPACRCLTVIELDGRLVPSLRRAVPHATVLNVDGVALLGSGDLEADVILSNLPGKVTPSLIELLPRLRFRTAVVAAGSRDSFAATSEEDVEFLTALVGPDFIPPQEGESFVFVVRRHPAS